MSAASDAARLRALADRIAPSLRRAYLRALDQLRASFATTEVVRALDSGDIELAVQRVFDSAQADAALRAIRVKYVEGVVQLLPPASDALPRVPGRLAIRVQAPVVSPELIAAARRFEDNAFARITAQARDGLRARVAAELERGIGPRQIASALKTQMGVGLTAYDEQLVGSFRRALVEGRTRDALARALRDVRFDRSLANGTLTPEKIERMVTAYRRKLVAFRADTFARTTAIQAANEASLASWESAVAQGAVDIDTIRRYWIVSDDERLCPICEPIPDTNADGVGLRDTFDTPVGPLLTPTAHPNCRCTVWIRVERAGVRQRPAPGTTQFSFAAVPLTTTGAL